MNFKATLGIAFAGLALAFQPDHALLRKVYQNHLSRCERDYGANDPRTAQAARDFGFFLKEEGDNKAAAGAFAKALRIDQVKYGADAPQSLAGIIALAAVSEPADAEALLRRSLASKAMNSQLAIPALSTLGDLRLAAGDPKGAAACWRLALQHVEAVRGPESEDAERILYSLSQAVDVKESVELLARALVIAQHLWGDRHPETATCEVNLARALLKAGHNEDAAEQARAALSAFEASLGPRHPRVAAALSTFAEALTAQGKSIDAEPLYRRAWEIDRQALGEKDPRTIEDARALRALK